MIQVATPVSLLFNDTVTAVRIIAASDCLEGRDNNDNWSLQEKLFHFDASIVNIWDDNDRQWIEEVVNSHDNLELISFHVASCCSCPIKQGRVFLPGGETFPRKRLLENGADNLRWVKQLLNGRPIRIALENNNYYPTEAYTHVMEPGFLYQLINDNNVLFLFDLAHAHISSHNMKLSYNSYISGLPLEQTVQLHISQWAVDDQGMAFDSHELPDQALNDEVCSLIHQYDVEFVTIEYYKNCDDLLATLAKYRIILGQ
jgi:uncharacterized protein (UPF0276 family)